MMFRRLLVCLAVVAGAVAAAPAATAAPAAPAAPAQCVRYDDRGNCELVTPIEEPGTPGESGTPGGPSAPPSGSPAGPVSPCGWVTVADPLPTTRAAYPDAPPDAIWQVWSCGGPVSENSGMGFRWVAPGDDTPAPTPPSPDVLATLAYITVQAQMQAPTLASDPPPEVPAVVNTPVFVEVTNWQPEIVDGPTCVLGVCVTMTATPSLSFDPGDGSPAIACTAPGSRYVPGGAPMADQAADACAHTYRLRTGTDDRPAEWPGAVTVSWEVSWTSGTVSGTFPDLTFSTPLPRAVDEVSAVVVDGTS